MGWVGWGGIGWDKGMKVLKWKGGEGLRVEHRERDVVQQWPEHIVAEAIIEQVPQLWLEEDWDAREGLLLEQLLPHILPLVLGDVHPDPSHPSDRDIPNP